MRDSIELERLGIPTVTLVTTSFQRLARVTSEALGMPDQALVVIPHPMGGIAADAVRAKIRSAFPDISQKLTAWSPARAQVTSNAAAQSVRIEGSVSEVNREFRARGWSAGLPFIPPTRDLVDHLLTGTRRAADEVVWNGVPPRMGVLTVETLAACAAMAGCQPEHMPILLSIVDALQDPNSWYAHQATTTGTESLLFLVNGPIIRELDLAFGTGAAGLWYHPNAAIGYAIGLVSKIVGGSRPPDQDKSTLASPADLLNWALAENELENPWNSFAVEHGFASSDNVVTTKVVYPPIDIGDHQSESGEDLLHYIAHCINQPFVYAMRHQPVLLALCPEHAATLAGDGYSKSIIREYLWHNARYPANVYARPAWQAGSIRANDDFPDLHYGSKQPLPIVAKPEDIQIIVVGGPGKHSHFFPGPKGIVSRLVNP